MNSTEVLDQAGKSGLETLELTTRQLWEMLDGKVLSKGEVSGGLAKRLPEKLSYWCKGFQA